MRRRLVGLLVCAWGSACVEYSWLYGDAGRDAGRADATVDGARGDASPPQDRIVVRDGADDVSDARSEEDRAQPPMDAQDDGVTTADVVDVAVVPRDGGMDVGCIAAGQMLCGGSCVNPHTSPTNCGSCGRVCSTGFSCSDGGCVCPDGQIVCNDRCVDRTNDPMNCGACGTTCSTTTGQTCVDARCGCAAGLTSCGAGVCANLLSDPLNCGACGTRCEGTNCLNGVCECPTGRSRCGSRCIDLNSDSANCGRCGNSCPTAMPTAMVCSDGRCCQTNVSCGETTCCPGTSCRPIDFGGPRVCCFEAMHSCMADVNCCGQMLCISGFCAAQGNGSRCAADADCISRHCRSRLCSPL